MFYLAAAIPPFFAEVAILLVLAALIAYVGYRLKLVPIVGFLLTGVVIGPNALGLVANQELVDATAQIGVILLLFTIGIEFSLEKLVRIKRLVFGGGLLQVLLTTGLTLLILMSFGVSWQASLFTGFLVALSSTAIVLKLLGSKGETNTEPGQASLGILIFQDLSIIVMVLLVPMLAGEVSDSSDIFLALGKATLIIVVSLFGARRVMPIVLERVAKTCSQELFLLALIAICFGMALLASLAGVSLELGAFLAGLIVSESRFSEHAFGEILPLQILFSATFFVSVGMLLDPAFLFTNLPLVLGVVVLVLLLKFLTTAFSLRVLGYSLSTAVTTGFFLAQVGEFSFVLERAGRELDLYPAGMETTGSKTFIAATVVLMVLTPLLSQLGQKLVARLQPAGSSEEPSEMESQGTEEETQGSEEHFTLQNHVVLAGYGATSRAFSSLLKAADIPQIVVTLSPTRAQQAEAQGIPVFRGDPTRQNALLHARVSYAKMLFVADDDPELAHKVARVVRTINPTVKIIARSRTYAPADELHHAGTDLLLADEHEVVVQLFAEMLRDYHVEPAEMEQCLGSVKHDGYLSLRDKESSKKLAPIGAMLRGALDTRTVTLRENAPIVGKTLEDVHFSGKGLDVKAIKRGDMIVNRPDNELTLRLGDQLTLMGEARDFAACALLFSGHNPPQDNGSVVSPGSFSENDIHLYGADWCLLTGGFQVYFRRHGYPYTFHNIEQDESAKEAVIAMNNGKLKFPMVVVGDVVMKNPPIDELVRVLKEKQVVASVQS
ncbi:MAG: cation:proton antiporter [Bacteroidota bacterium]